MKIALLILLSLFLTACVADDLPDHWADRVKAVEADMVLADIEGDEARYQQLEAEREDLIKQALAEQYGVISDVLGLIGINTDISDKWLGLLAFAFPKPRRQSKMTIKKILEKDWRGAARAAASVTGLVDSTELAQKAAEAEINGRKIPYIVEAPGEQV